MQTNLWLIFEETVKVKKTLKKTVSWKLHSLGYSKKEITQDSQVNMNLSTVKRLKSKIKAHGSIMREEGSGRSEKLSEIHKSNILKLIADSPFNTSKRIALKLKNNYEVELHRSIISRLLVQNGYKWKGKQIVFRNNEQGQENRFKFCIKNKKDTGVMYLLQMMLLSIFYHQETSMGCIRWFIRNDKNKVLPKDPCLGAFNS